MVQFYFLSVLLNVLAGLTLLSGVSGEKLREIKDFLRKAAFRSGLGAATALVGFVKLIVRAPFDTLPVAGDLLPAFAGLITGIALLADVYMTRGEETEVAQRLQKTLRYARIPIAVLGIGAGVLHFAVPQLAPF